MGAGGGKGYTELYGEGGGAKGSDEGKGRDEDVGGLKGSWRRGKVGAGEEVLRKK